MIEILVLTQNIVPASPLMYRDLGYFMVLMVKKPHNNTKKWVTMLFAPNGKSYTLDIDIDFTQGIISPDDIEIKVDYSNKETTLSINPAKVLKFNLVWV